jgi:hypothetical protein
VYMMVSPSPPHTAGITLLSGMIPQVPPPNRAKGSFTPVRK